MTTVLSVTSEFFPLIKTGGLADVAGALPAALADLGVATRTLIPAYPALLAALPSARVLVEPLTVLGAEGRLLEARTAEGAGLLLLDLPELYARPGNPYIGPDGLDWPDNARRFAALSRAAAEIGFGLLPAWRPDILHAHDWQAALAPAYLALEAGRRGPRPATILTVHNMAFQGRYPPTLIGALGLPPEAYAVEGYECWGTLGFLKAGLYYADKLTTVSPTYAREIRTQAHGHGLDGLLRTRAADLVGITNGLDTAVWDPATDPLLPARYAAPENAADRANWVERAANRVIGVGVGVGVGKSGGEGSLAGKAACKAALQERMGMALDPRAMLAVVISRLTSQKGLDLALETLPALLAGGGQLALLGSGDAPIEAGFAAAAAARPDRVACRFGYDEPLAHLLQAGGDAILIPSRFEPCGLTQLAGLRYGTLPIVARVGGLADTVIDASPAALGDGVATGFQFAPVTAEALDDALARAIELWYDPPAWAAVRQRAMTREVGWNTSARRYQALYAGLKQANGR